MIHRASKTLFIREFNHGVTYKGLARTFGRSVETMRKWRQRFGLPPRQRKGVPTQHVKYTGFYLDVETHDKFSRAAIDAGLTRSEFLRQLLKEKVNGEANSSSRSLQGYSHVAEGTR